jgi:hypothetical protein
MSSISTILHVYNSIAYITTMKMFHSSTIRIYSHKSSRVGWVTSTIHEYYICIYIYPYTILLVQPPIVYHGSSDELGVIHEWYIPIYNIYHSSNPTTHLSPQGVFTSSEKVGIIQDYIYNAHMESVDYSSHSTTTLFSQDYVQHNQSSWMSI